MTSTHFNIGLASEKKSSRVLRPPGGGHTDIFGINGNQIDAITPSKRRNYPQSTIGDCFTMGDSKHESKINGVEKTIVENGNEQNLEGKTEVDNVSDENRAPGDIQQVKEPETKVESTPARSGRVPPGGFSTALW